MEKPSKLDNAASSVLETTGSLLKAHRTRIAGTNECLMAAHSISSLLGAYCDDAVEERFTLHPGSLLKTGKIIAVSYPVIALFLFIGGYFSLFSLAICILIAIYISVHYVACGTLFDPLFKKVEGCNVSGRMEPAGDAIRQIIVSGHHDAPFVFSFFTQSRKLAGFRFLAAVAFYIFSMGMSAYGAFKALTGIPWSLHGVTLAVIIVGTVFVLPLYNFISRTPSPGAGDNLNACSIAIYLARYFDEKRKNETPLQHTRLVFLSTDGEEAGQRGAIEYAARHADELNGIPASVINIDSVYKLKDLSIITRDRHGTQPLSGRLAEKCADIASELGYKVKLKPLPPGAVGTDAAAFAKAGIDAITLLGMSTSVSSDDLVYHTEKDTVDAIEPGAVKAVLDIVIRYIEACDKQDPPKNP